jgi:hypothetical protein
MKHSFIQWLLFLLLCLPLSTVFSQEICPAPNELQNSDIDQKQFQKRLWKMVYGEDNGGSWEGSILGFENEIRNEEQIQLTGYIWWILKEEFVGCEKVSGNFNLDTRTLELYTVFVTSNAIAKGVTYSTIVSEDGVIIEGRWHGIFVAPGNWRAEQMSLTVPYRIPDPD